MPVNTLRVPAGILPVEYDDDRAIVNARSEWAPEFAIYDLATVDEVLAADPDDFDDAYLWAWSDEARGTLRARSFASHLGIPEDEATGSAAVRMTDYLSRDLTIIQGKGSVIETRWSPEGWVRLAAGSSTTAQPNWTELRLGAMRPQCFDFALEVLG